MTEGRLYRSGGATGAAADAATPALSKDQRGKLRTTEITDAPDVAVAAAVVEDADVVEAPSAPAGSEATGRSVTNLDPRDPSDSMVQAIVAPLVAPVTPPPIREEVVIDETPGAARDDAGMSATQVWLVITGFTFIIGLIDGFLHKGGSEASALTWITGLALVLSTVVAALRVRRSARWYPVIVPPLAFLIVTLTAGQFGLSTTGSLVIREGLMVFTTLGRNAIWIIASVIIALVIVLVKPALKK